MSYNKILGTTSKEINKEMLINEIMFLYKRLDELWEYHPDNSNGINIVEEYNEVKQQIEDVEKDLNRFK